MAATLLIPTPVNADNKAMVFTSWHRSDGIEIDNDIYFLSYYTLYRPGKVIIPMFIKTNAKIFFSEFSLYRLTTERTGKENLLERVWSRKADLSGSSVDLQSGKYGRNENRIYFQWTGDWDKQNKRSLHPVLEYDTANGAGNVFSDVTQAPASGLEFHAPYVVSSSEVWLKSGQLPLSVWDLPSPLRYSPQSPSFLTRVLVQRMGDREFRAATLEALDRELDPSRMKRVLAEMEAERERLSDRSYNEYFVHYSALILMSDALRSERAPDIFTAAYDNDTELLKALIRNGADPNQHDDAGRTPLMYAVFGGAPDTLKYLFEQGADPEQETRYGQTAWFYAALSPLRPLYLEEWKR
jgi:Ankyrin repeats (3 copies)